MRPIQLTMKAFGPYKDKEVINFSDLQDHSLFVISGNTGAGKTTIFDAICFALYGSASGQDRDHHSMLRSHFAEPELHTAVELTFTIHNRIYRVLRQLAHKKPGNKTPTGERYEFFEKVDGKEIPVVERQIVSEINKKIEDILGLTENQFKQIVMLPQGEFLKLLTSDTENKEAILRRLFKTDHYQRLNELLRDRKNNIEEQFNQERLIYDQHIEHIRATLPERENSSLFITLNDEHFNEQQVITGLIEERDHYLARTIADEKAYRDATVLSEQAQQALYQARDLNKKFTNLAEKEKLLAKLKDAAPYMKQLTEKLANAERAEIIKPYDKQYKRMIEARKTQKINVKRLLNDVSQAEQQRDQAKKAFNREKENEPLRNETQKILDRLQEHLPFVQALSERQAKVMKLNERVKTLQKSFDQLEETVQANQKVKLETTKEIRQLEETLNNFSSLQQQLVTVKEKLERIENYEAAKLVFDQAQTDVTAKETAYTEAQTYYKQQEELLLNNQAHYLALHLHDGDPCPVCGSEHHPQKAVTAAGSLTQEQLMTLKKQLDDEASAYNQAVALRQTYKEQRDKSKTEIIKLNIQVANIAEIKRELQVKHKQLDENIADLLNKQSRLQLLRQKEQAEEKELDRLQEEREKARTNFLQEQTSLRQAQAVLASELERVPEDVRELEKLKKEITKTTKKITDLNEAYKQAETKFQASTEQITKLTTELQLTKKRLVEVEAETKENEQAFLTVLQDNKFVSADQYYSAILGKQEQDRLKEKIANYEQQLQVTIEQTKTLQKELANKERADLVALEERVVTVKQLVEQSHKTWQRSDRLQKEADRLREVLEKSATRIKKYEEKLNTIADIYNVTRGQNELRLSFERFLQIEYLEQIIHAANQRLQHLSKGQYWLQRSERQEQRGRQSGLAFDVFDEYTGKLRDVKTLSGGEKFNASLCLALGMSDVIQSFQGNISIETMFIDEGFGTLDEETLNKSIETLIDLQSSGRMIGVISHVQALKTIFPAVLEVTKSRTGYSQTEFIVN